MRLTRELNDQARNLGDLYARTTTSTTSSPVFLLSRFASPMEDPFTFRVFYKRRIPGRHRSITFIRLAYRQETRMIDRPKGAPFCSRNNETIFFQDHSSILTLRTPNVEDIARAIWQRQHDALFSDAITHNVKWRDQSIPSKFWDEFLLDAHAVLSLLYKKHIEYQNTRVDD